MTGKPRKPRNTNGDKTAKMLSRLSLHVLGREAGVTPKGKVVTEVKQEEDLDKVCRLCTSYGYLLNIQNNVRKTTTLAQRIEYLEKLAETAILKRDVNPAIQQKFR